MHGSRSSVKIPVAAQRGGLSPLHGYLLVMRGVTRPQRIALPDRRYRWEGEFEVTPSAHRAWHELFEADETGATIPFSYASPLGVRIGHEVLRLLGVNFKNILYVGWDVQLTRPDRVAPAVGERCRLVTEIEKVTLCSGQRAVLRLASRIIGEDGATLAVMGDSMMLRNLSNEDVEQIERATGTVGRPGLAPSQMPEPERIDSTTAARFPLFYAEDLGRRYGDLSGDTNFLHTNPYVLRLFGHERMFSHGMCTANKVLKTLFGDMGICAREMSISFKKPVFLGQTVELRVGDDRFEVCDGEDVVLARGSFRRFEETLV